jgi:hypothetical protein
VDLARADAGVCSLLNRAPYIRLAACAPECLLAQTVSAGAFCVCVAVGVQRTGKDHNARFHATLGEGGCFKETGALEHCVE